jgi:hypothetical protein
VGGLGEAETADGLALAEFRQLPHLLLLAAVGMNRIHDERAWTDAIELGPEPSASSS